MTNTDKNDFNATIGNTVLSAVHLAPYLPYELRFSDGTILHSVDIDNELMLLDTTTGGISNHRVEWGNILPILRPISDLNKTIFYNKYNEKRVLIEDHTIINNLSKQSFFLGEIETYYHKNLIENYEICQSLFELHFDVFGLIEKGLAVDINTLSVE